MNNIIIIVIAGIIFLVIKILLMLKGKQENIHLLPENLIFDNFNLQHLSNVMNMDEEDINEVKIYMLSILFRKKNYKKD